MNNQDLRTVQDVIAAFGEPDIGQPVGMPAVTPKTEGVPEATQAYPVQSVFISRGSIFRFCEPGTEPAAEVVAPN